MSSAICGWCGVHSHMPILKGPLSFWFGPETGETRVMAVHQCDHCTSLTLSSADLVDGEMGPAWSGDNEAAQLHQYAEASDQLSWYPPNLQEVGYKHVPAQVASAAREANSCFNSGYKRAAVQLARSVVEATSKDKGIHKGTIKQKIDEMFNQRLIREYVRDGAHEVRYLGNEMAHGDFTAPVTTEDASLVLTLMHELLVEVYEGPGRVQDAQTRRTARSGAQT